ncbi:MAG: PepSY-associated TM helix domain-containing protein [Opitutaceae bacterium]|jgi:uncharacterized iron-regulated membrane protein
MLRSVIFWLHLTAGLVAGLVIAVMSFTGAALAFENEIVAWAERDVRRIDIPANAKPLSLDELVAGFREDYPDVRFGGITVSSDPHDAFAVSASRDGTYYINPYTGDIREPDSTRTHDFMHLMEDWHRFLARSGDQRPYGKAVTGACNLAFLFLAISGLWLWWPRAWNRRILRPSLLFTGAKGKARDWNWHNVVGFWSLPVLIVLTTSGAVISYRWAGNLVYRLAGETPSAQGPTAPATDYKIERPEGVKKITYSAALARFQTEFPAWETITLREGLPPRRGAPQPTLNADAQPPTPSAQPTSPARARGPQPYSATVRESGRWYVAASTQAVLHPFTGELLDRTGYANQSAGRQARSWLRFLHTGQALGWFGQLIAGLACVGGLVLVYTGFALSWRRFRRRP